MTATIDQTKLPCTDANAHRMYRWFTDLGGVAVWKSADGSNISMTGA